MKFCVLGKDEEKVRKLREKIISEGLIYSEDKPDFVFSSGGDGMFLISERKFPGIPKIITKNSHRCNLETHSDLDFVIKSLKEKNYKIEDLKKLEAIYEFENKIKKLKGVNDVVIRNNLPTEAIRFCYRINDGDWSEILIGDGLVISTPLGSKKGAYFYSVTKKSFEEGFGIAFNNITQEKEHLNLENKDIIEIEFKRGVGVLVVDNNRNFINLKMGGKIRVYFGKEVARLVKVGIKE